MSNSKCHFSLAKNRTEADMPAGGICDVPRYPCKHCRHYSVCSNMHCESFAKFYRDFMADSRAYPQQASSPKRHTAKNSRNASCARIPRMIYPFA